MNRKIALITDTHFGARGDSIKVLDAQEQMFEESFFPICQKYGIKNVFHLGDLVDKNRTISFSTYDRIRNMFLEPMRKNNMTMDIILGNHDVTYKNFDDSNSGMLLQDYTNIFVHSSARPQVLYGKYHIMVCPWINENNKNESLDMMFNQTFNDPPGPNILMGHFDIHGFIHEQENVNKVIFNQSDFKDYDIVLSGHYHNKQTIGNIHYLGSPWPIAWGEDTVDKGFYIFDLETLELTFIKNENTLFMRIEYDDNKPMQVPKTAENKFVKLSIKSKQDAGAFAVYKEQLDRIALDVVVDTPEKFIFNPTGENKIEVTETKPTFEIVKETVENMKFTAHEEEIRNDFLALYRQAEREVEIE
jgi:DNA repair exonuclease SbcCD nuclease subunit